MRLGATILAVVGAAVLTFAPGGKARADAGDEAAEQAWLDVHNIERAAFGSAPLRWDPVLAREARDWAEQLARTNAMRHSPRDERRDTGENLWMGTAGAYRPAQMIESFAGEKRHFRPGTFPQVSRTGNWADVGHYTQIVWEETRGVGCATAKNRQFEFLVCRYWPAGNVIGTQIAPRGTLASR